MNSKMLLSDNNSGKSQKMSGYHRGNGQMQLPRYEIPEGMPLSVFNDRYAREVDGELQDYAARVRDMVIGNTMLDKNISSHEIEEFIEYAVAGITPLSGRHIQHGDASQDIRNIEVFTNCSTAAFSFLNFYLLLNGSGVGRDYSSESCRVDWEYMPNVRVVLDGGLNDDGDVSKGSHADFSTAFNEFNAGFDSLKEARHKYDSESEDVRWIKVRDSREGWAEVIAVLETAAFHKNHKDSLFIFDFSGVRPKGSPIHGMQNRQAQGPIPLMRAILRILTIKGAKMKPWKQALFIDHYLAAIVVMGMVRRSARMATKSWRDRDVIEFIDVKRGGFLWSANNSILVDDEFWAQAADPRPSHGRRVFEAAIGAAYYDQTGEPGFINTHKLCANTHGMEHVTVNNYLNKSYDFKLHPKTYEMIDKTLTILKSSKQPFITNPCGEIVLAKYGGYCVIGDVVLSKAPTKEAAKRAVALTTRALIRTNLMKALYQTEVDRTNRIGVGITGIFEYAWQQFKLSFYDLISVYDHVMYGSLLDNHTAMEFWYHISDLSNTVYNEARSYSLSLGRVVPHSFTTIKPSGTISKVMACTEGAHLPPYLYYIRWVVCEKNSPKHHDYVARGYPVKDVSHQYHNCVVVGFPTKHPICDIVAADKLVTANDVTPEDQFKWVILIEKFWFGKQNHNNQVSYTLKYDQKQYSHDRYNDMILEWQPLVRCCSVMPFTDSSAYSYLPEERIDKDKYEELIDSINRAKVEDYNESEIECAGGVCPTESRIR